MIETEMPALLWIGGAPVPASTGETFPVFDPATEEVIGEAPRGVAEDIDRAVDAARAAARSREWRDMDPFRRGRILLAWARRIDAEREPIARLLSRENGKPLAEAIDEVETTSPLHRVLRGLGRQVRRARRRGAGRRARVRAPRAAGRRRPGGALELPARRLRPRRRAGPDGREHDRRQALGRDAAVDAVLASLSDEAGMPPGVLNVVSGFGADAGAHLAAHAGIDGLAFCGSVATGREVLRAAAERITPVVSLELGGKSAKIVFDDADLDAAASAAAHGITYNAGQSCGTQSRVLVPRALVDDVARPRPRRPGRRADRPGHRRSGHGPARVRGPARPGPRPTSSPVGQTARESCTAAADRRRADGRGYFIEPTLFVEARPGMRIVQEEIFGPVRLPPAVRLGGGGDRDRERDRLRPVGVRLDPRPRSRAHRVARRLDVSVVGVNGGGGFDVESPWGGVKQSGFGREGAFESLLQYSRVKASRIDVPDHGSTGGQGRTACGGTRRSVEMNRKFVSLLAAALMAVTACTASRRLYNCAVARSRRRTQAPGAARCRTAPLAGPRVAGREQPAGGETPASGTPVASADISGQTIDVLMPPWGTSPRRCSTTSRPRRASR